MPKRDIVLSDRFWDDDTWANRNYQALSKRYPNKWVAVFNKKVISFNENLTKVKKEAARIAKGEDFPVLLFVEKGAHVYKG